MDKLEEHREKQKKYYYEKVKPVNEMKPKKTPGRKPTQNQNNRYLYLRKYMREYYRKHFKPSNRPRGRPRKYQTEEQYLKAKNEAEQKFKCKMLASAS